MVALDAEVLCQVDNLHAFRYRMLLEERLALAVTEAEEHDVDLLKGHRVGKAQVGVADESFVHVAHQIAGVALRVGKYNLCLRVVEQQADELTARIACCT